jgi:hypothetical protein
VLTHHDVRRPIERGTDARAGRRAVTGIARSAQIDPIDIVIVR